MTNDEFRQSYQLVRRLAGGQVSTYHGLNRAGQGVLVHVLDPTADAQRMLEDIDALRAQDRGRILATLEVDGRTVIVTEFMAELETFPAWLESRTVAEAGAQVDEGGPHTDVAAEPPGSAAVDTGSERPTGPGAGAAAAEPGEYTRMFKLGQTATRSGQQPVSDAAPTSGHEPPAEPVREPADSSGLFRLGESLQPEPAGFSGLSKLGETPLDGVGAAEDDALDHARPDEPEPTGAADAAEDPAETPGEYTRLFKLGKAQAGTDRPAAGERSDRGRSQPDLVGPREPAGGTVHPHDKPGEPGEYTRMFKLGGKADPTGASPPETNPGDSALPEADEIVMPLPPPPRPAGPDAYEALFKWDLPPVEPPVPAPDPGESLDYRGRDPAEILEVRWRDADDPLGTSTGVDAPGAPVEDATEPGAIPDSYLERLEQARPTPRPAPPADDTPIRMPEVTGPGELTSVPSPPDRGPSEYTRVIAGYAEPAKPTPPVAPAAPPAPSRMSRRERWLWIAAAILFVLLIVVFVLFIVFGNGREATDAVPPS